ncbi:MAG: PAS domain S-box protein, partial [Betaproteobacteria bacterium]|nr:PAS domain S-box protein [Betaproteobacteria bacterium]
AGTEVAASGSFIKNQDQHITLHAPVDASLLWDKRFVLHARLVIRDGRENRIGSVLFESELSSLETAISDMAAVGNTSEVALCSTVSAGEMDCYLRNASVSQFKRLQRVVDNVALPMNYALEGGTGVIFAKDYRRQNVAAAYSPVGHLGIGMALKIDRSELYDPITQQLKRVAILLFALVLAGGLMLYLMVSPLVQKLIDSRREAVRNFQELQRLSEKNSILLRNASDGLHILDQDGTLIECSDSFCHMLGYTRDELLGRNVSHWDAMLTAEELRTALKERLFLQEHSLFETRHRQKDGTIIDVEVSSRPIPLEGRMVLFSSSRDITERIQLHEALRHERDFMDAIFQSAGSLILAIDRTGCIVRFNRAAEACSGYTFEEVRNKPFFWKNFLLEEQQSQVESVFRTALSGNIRTRYENAWVSREGKTRVLDWANTLIFDARGKMEYLLAVGIDITERKQAESLIRIQSNALNASTNGIAIADAADPELPLIYVNPAFEEITGYSESELLGKNCRFLHGADRDQPDLNEIRSALREGRTGKATLRNYRKDGSLFWNRLHVSPIRDENGQVTHFLGVSNDITDRRNAEEYMRLVASVFHHADEAIVITDARASILEVNPAFTRMTGYEREEVLGKNPDVLRSEQHDAAFYEDLWKKLAVEGHWSGEVWNKRKNGEIYPARMTLSAIRNADGETIRHVALFSDISDLKAQQQALERMAHHDALTGLPNRNLLGDRLDMAVALAKRNQERFAVCFVDLDGFKAVNDSLGHNAGDLLLVEIASRLHAVSRATDTVSRLGGDEFVLIFTNIVDEAECQQLTERILAAIKEPIPVCGHEVRISASIGVALFPDVGTDGHDLLRLADQAMYAAKQSGRERIIFSRPHGTDPQD